jgi:hypothetical protein
MAKRNYREYVLQALELFSRLCELLQKSNMPALQIICLASGVARCPFRMFDLFELGVLAQNLAVVF